jgi:hypothetical protein
LFKLGVREGEISGIGGVSLDTTAPLAASDEGASAVGDDDDDGEFRSSVVLV